MRSRRNRKRHRTRGMQPPGKWLVARWRGLTTAQYPVDCQHLPRAANGGAVRGAAVRIRCPGKLRALGRMPGPHRRGVSQSRATLAGAAAPAHPLASNPPDKVRAPCGTA